MSRRFVFDFNQTLLDNVSSLTDQVPTLEAEWTR